MDTIIEEITKFFENIAQNKEPEDQWKDVLAFEGQLELSRAANRSLNTTFKTLLEEDEFNINTKYVHLKAENARVLKQIETLKSELERLKVTVSDEKKKMALEAENKAKQAEELEQKRIQDLRNQIDMQKLEHQQRVEQLNNELELVQAAADLEQDEIETTLRKELVDLNTKIRRTQQSNDYLKLQIEELMTRKRASENVTSHHQVDLGFFQLERLDEMFQCSMADNARVGSPQPQEEQQQHIVRQQKPLYKHNFDESANTISWNQASSSNNKYQPLQIVTNNNNASHQQLAGHGQMYDRSDGKGQPKRIQNNEANMQLSEENNVRTKWQDDVKKSPLADQKQENIGYHTPLFGYSKRQPYARNNDVLKVIEDNTLIMNENTKELSSKKKIRAIRRNSSPTKSNKQRNEAKKQAKAPRNEKKVVKNPVKRRKLFNLGDLDYLETMQLDSDSSD